VRDRAFAKIIIISTLPKRTSKWLRRDLARRVALGLPVTAVVPGHRTVGIEDMPETAARVLPPA
jgi:hypothetical protein